MKFCPNCGTEAISGSVSSTIDAYVRKEVASALSYRLKTKTLSCANALIKQKTLLETGIIEPVCRAPLPLSKIPDGNALSRDDDRIFSAGMA
jgi:hypothetical protein